MFDIAKIKKKVKQDINNNIYTSAEWNVFIDNVKKYYQSVLNKNKGLLELDKKAFNINKKIYEGYIGSANLDDSKISNFMIDKDLNNILNLYSKYNKNNRDKIIIFLNLIKRQEFKNIVFEEDINYMTEFIGIADNLKV